MLNFNLDKKTEALLAEILVEENTSSEELISRLIHQHWESLQPPKTIVERRGGHPQYASKPSVTNPTQT